MDSALAPIVKGKGHNFLIRSESATEANFVALTSEKRE